MIKNVTLHYQIKQYADPWGWESTWLLSWEQIDKKNKKWVKESREIVGIETKEEAIKDSVDYFGGLVTAEKITII